MRRADRRAHGGHHLDDCRRRGLGRETADRLQGDHVDADCPDDFPAADGGACRHRERTDDFYPHGDAVARAPHARADKRQGDDAHGFLGIVASVRVGHKCGGQNLKLGEPFIDPVLRSVLQQQKQQLHHKEARYETDHGGGDERQDHLVHDITPLDGAKTARGHRRRADQAADQSVRRAARQAEIPRQQIPEDAPGKRRDDDILRDRARHNPFGNRGGDFDAHERTHEIQAGGHDDRIAGGEHPGGHRRRDGVCRIVKAVDKVKGQRHEDNDEKR